MQARKKVSKSELSSSSTRKSEFRSTLQELLAENYSSMLDSSWLNNPWRAVEAYHFFLLVQKLFYGGFFEEALKTVSLFLVLILSFTATFLSLSLSLCGLRPSSSRITRISFLLWICIHSWPSPVLPAGHLGYAPRSVSHTPTS